MRSIASFLLAAVVCVPGVIARAQGSASDGDAASSLPQKATVVVQGLRLVRACPVQFSVQRYGLAASVRNAKQGAPDEFNQSLRLMFDHRGLGGVQSVEVIVHGTSGKAELLRVESEPADTRSQTFRLSSSGGAFEPTQLLLTRNLPVVTSLELTRVEYADGRVWSAPGPAACSFRPSPFVLVNAEVR